jgi:integrase
VLILVEPKSATSHRTIALPDFVRDAFRAHRTRQREARLQAGPRWRDDPHDLVFRSTIGTPLDGITVTRRFQRLLKSAGLRHQHFHDLHHSCASLLLAQGVAPRVAVEVLGHSQISLTMGAYVHVGPALGQSAADKFDALGLGSGDAEHAA